jgi:hypothetical protein
MNYTQIASLDKPLGQVLIYLLPICLFKIYRTRFSDIQVDLMTLKGLTLEIINFSSYSGC